MRPELDTRGLHGQQAWQHALRFAFGGAIAVGAGLVATHWGPGIGGLFLAFPAILPASLTLVKQREGRRSAIDDARGARLGAIALGVFAAVLMALGDSLPPTLALASATLAWIATSMLTWSLVYGSRSRTRGYGRT